jgi:hypothetical protein
MAFSIRDYNNAVGQRLGRMLPIYRRCFALWCLRAIFVRWGGLISGKLAESDVQFMSSSIDFLWKCVISNEQPSAEQLSGIEERC